MDPTGLSNKEILHQIIRMFERRDQSDILGYLDWFCGI